MSIHILDNVTINKIAAGEVVERPSSVVKELVENSIDAGASAVTVEIKDGGTTLIKITDNGGGISQNDVETAFLRHATSKIKSIDDLENVMSLGFRGEALASIAAVSQIEMITKTNDSEMGTLIEISGGNVLSKMPLAANTGTSISVKNLFFNVPARRKFLKKPATESSYISDIINKIALGHTEVSIKYMNNSNVMLHTSGNNDLKAAFFQIYGKDILSQMLDIDISESGMRLHGIMGKPHLSRSSRTYENLFINGRFIKNETVSRAIEDAYKTRLMIGKFPVFALNFSIPPDSLDINVHPAKLEVRFKDNYAVYDFIYTAVLELFKDKVLIPKENWDSGKKQNEATKSYNSNTTKTQNKENEIKSEPEKSSTKYRASNSPKSIDELMEIYKQSESQNTFKGTHKMEEKESPYIKTTEVKQEMLPSHDKTFFNNFKIIGQIFSTYWIVEQNNSIFLIDQHAAHERVLYEKFMREFNQSSVSKQILLEPYELKVTDIEIETINDNIEILEKLGFDIEKTADEKYFIKTMPFIFKQPETLEFFNNIIDILQQKEINSVVDNKILSVATMACKAAVKANDNLNIKEAEALVEELLKLDNPFSCPHGRPTIIELTEYELEKKFKRI